MKWTVIFHEDFEEEFDKLTTDVQDELYAEAGFVEVWTGNRSSACRHFEGLPHYANMKELRFEAGDGEWRVAFAFDPERRAILLVAGDKTGVGERSFING